jgi:transcriptional regulator with XRE-family HTH domain
MTEPFSEKLALILKALSMSRARLASELAIDKSVVARWASGATAPSGHNLSQLTQLMAQVIPGFTGLDWDRDLDSLAQMLGVDSRRGSNHAPTPPRPTLDLPLMEHILATSALRARAYEGFYRSTRAHAAVPGQFIHDQCMVRLGDDGLLRFKLATGGVYAEGWVLLVQMQIYLIGTEFSGGSLTFAILHGVNTVKAGILDGITLTSIMDIGRTTAAAPVVYERTGDLSGDRAADDQRLLELGKQNPLSTAEMIPEALRRHLMRGLSPDASGGRIDGVLRLPLAQTLSRGPDPAAV